MMDLKSLAEYGFDFSQPWKQLFLYGLISGTVTVIFITIPEVVWGPFYLRDPIFISDILRRFFKGLVSGTLIGIVEEFFFRGFIF